MIESTSYCAHYCVVQGAIHHLSLTVLTSPGVSPEPPQMPFRAAVPEVLPELVSIKGTYPQFSAVRRTFKILLVFALTVWLIKTSIVEAFFIPSGSMGPTVMPRDYILVPKFTYGLRLPFLQETLFQWRSPNRGDIIVFNREDDPSTVENEAGENLVKRVIGLPGDLIEVRAEVVYVNQNPLLEPYAYWSLHAQHDKSHQAFNGAFSVPSDSVFVLGDNRDVSKDSRSWNNPFVKIGKIQGRAAFVYWSGSNVGRSGTILK
jgi:signal peptidase I